MKFDEHEAWNERMAKLHDPDSFITKTGFILRQIEALRLQLTKKYLDALPSDVVLDLGCGSGNLLAQLTGAKIVGVDLSESLLAQAKQRTKNQSNIELIKSFAETLPFPDNTFDRIVCSEVLEHVADPKTVLQEIKRVAKPDAQIVLTVPNENMINACKRIVITLGLKKWVAGEYNMSDNMLSEWHKSEIEIEWILRTCKSWSVHLKTVAIPFLFFPLHRAAIFSVKKTG